MKNIFIFLIAINAIFAGYVFWGKGALADERREVQMDSSALKVSSLALFSELTDDEVAYAEKPEDVPESSPSDLMQAGDSGCVLVGAFDSLLYAEYFLEKMISLGGKASIKKLSTPGEQRHNVLVHPFDERDTVFETLFKIKEMGLNGAIVSGADNKSQVSLGSFEGVEGAQDLIERMNAQGVKAFTYSLREAKKSIWVELDMRFGGKIDEEVIKFASDKNNYIEIRQNVCLGIANS